MLKAAWVIGIRYELIFLKRLMMAKLERKVGHAINKDKNGAVYLDVLASDRGNFKVDKPTDCGFTCEWKQEELKF